LVKLCGHLTTEEIEVVADVFIFATVQKIDVDAEPSVLFQSLKSPQANVVAQSDESLCNLIRPWPNSGSSSNSNSGDDSSLLRTPGASKRLRVYE